MEVHVEDVETVGASARDCHLKVARVVDETALFAAVNNDLHICEFEGKTFPVNFPSNNFLFRRNGVKNERAKNEQQRV